MKPLFYPLLFATVLVSAACSNDLESDANVIDPSNKTAISFVGEDNSAAMTRFGFADATQIAMHIRSTHAKDNSKIRETRTWATAKKDGSMKTDTYSDTSRHPLQYYALQHAFAGQAVPCQTSLC